VADIDVVPKKRSRMWLWILAAIVVALIIWAIVAGMRPGPQQMGVTGPPALAPAATLSPATRSHAALG
jgi:hypothetical protein